MSARRQEDVLRLDDNRALEVCEAARTGSAGLKRKRSEYENGARTSRISQGLAEQVGTFFPPYLLSQCNALSGEVPAEAVILVRNRADG